MKSLPWYTWCGPYDNPCATRPGAEVLRLYAGGAFLVQAYLRRPYITARCTQLELLING